MSQKAAKLWAVKDGGLKKSLPLDQSRAPTQAAKGQLLDDRIILKV